MPRTNTRYVDVDAATGGNGTTSALSGTNCAYKSLNIWEAARDDVGDLPTNDTIEECICESSDGAHTADTTAVTIDGWTTDATRYISIKTSAGARHAGVWSTSKYRLAKAGGIALTVGEDYVRIDGLQISNSTGSANNEHVLSVTTQTASNRFSLSNCIIVGHGARRLRLPRHRRHGGRGRARPPHGHALFRHLLRLPVGGHRVRAPRLRPRRRELHRGRPRRAAQGHLQAPGSARRRHMGGTMRLGSYVCRLKSGSRAAAIYGASEVRERHRHRYEFNQAYKETLERHGLVISGLTPDGKFVEIAELPDHPWYVAVQFHPEFKSRPLQPHPLFAAFVGASVAHRQARPAEAVGTREVAS